MIMNVAVGTVPGIHFGLYEWYLLLFIHVALFNKDSFKGVVS